MKKVFLTLIALMTLGMVGAQAQNMPKRGSVSTEVMFNPFDQNGHTFSLDGIKVRYFITERDVFRAKLGFSLSSEKFQSNTSVNDYSRKRSGKVLFDLGYERHFPVAKRVDLYLGGLFGLEKFFAMNKGEVQHSSYKMRGSCAEVGSSDNPLANVSPDNRAYSAFTLAAIGGMDIYLYKGLYIGTELGFEIAPRKYDKVKYTVNDTEITTHDDSSGLDLGFYIEPVVRLGYTF